jgi:hypothetical protein
MGRLLTGRTRSFGLGRVVISGDHLSQVTFTASANKTYYLMVWSYNGTAGGHLALDVATP